MRYLKSKFIPEKIDPKGKLVDQLLDNYWRRANQTMQNDIGEITQRQIEYYLQHAEKHGQLEMIDPDRLIKVGNEAEDVRMVPYIEQKRDWDSEIFSDPILKRFCLIENDPNKIYCDIGKNYYRALKTYDDIDPYEQYMAYNHYPDYFDIRTTNGERVNPPRIYNKDDLYAEKVRLKEKTFRLFDKIKHPQNYFKNPKKYEEKLFKKWGKRSNMWRLYETYYQNCYVISLANHGYRGVRSRIEQWVWEQHVMRYYFYQETRVLLNNIILDDDGIYCKILVPNTYNEFGILDYVENLTKLHIYNGMIQTVGYKNFNMMNYYKRFPEIANYNFVMKNLVNR